MIKKNLKYSTIKPNTICNGIIHCVNTTIILLQSQQFELPQYHTK